MALPETLQSVILYFSDPIKTLEVMVAFRWPDGITCPRCAGKVASFISTRSVWTCKACKKQFSVKVGTIFEDSPIGLDKWLVALWLICNDKNGISSYEVSRALAISQKSCWFMLHRLRLAMKAGSFEKKLCGEIEADETFVGGKAKNMHLSKISRLMAQGRYSGAGMTGKTVVMGLLERHGEARIKVLPTRRKKHVQPEVRTHVEPGSKIYTDALKSYEGLEEYMHDFIDHSEEYVRGAVHTNGLENFWSLFKRSLKVHTSRSNRTTCRPMPMSKHSDLTTGRLTTWTDLLWRSRRSLESVLLGPN
jgi:transposase-like protein